MRELWILQFILLNSKLLLCITAVSCQFLLAASRQYPPMGKGKLDIILAATI